MIPILFSNYHNGANRGIVEDFASIGKVYMPKDSWGKIGFYAPNDEHADIAKLISYREFLALPPLALVYMCNQIIPEWDEFYEARGRKDIKVYLTAQSISAFPDDGADFVLTHDLDYHRRTTAQTKMIYFCKPKIYYPQLKDLQAAYDKKSFSLYINNFRSNGFEPEYEDAKRFRELWIADGGRGGEFFGYDNEDAWLSEPQVQAKMLENTWTLVFKRRETWGQVPNASMLLGTPLLMLTKYRNNLLTEYEITPDTALIGETVEELADKALHMSYEQYETLSWQSRTMASMYALDEPRRTQLRWFFSKVQERLKDKGGGV